MTGVRPFQICTEWPMKSTQANFWSMVYDHDVRVIVVMDPVVHEPPKSGKSSKNESKRYERFWPTETAHRSANGGTIHNNGSSDKSAAAANHHHPSGVGQSGQTFRIVLNGTSPGKSTFTAQQ